HGFFQFRNRYICLVVCDQRKSQEPISRSVARIYFFITLEFADCFIIVPRMKLNPSNIAAANSERIHFPCAPRRSQPLVRTPLASQPVRIHGVNACVIRTQLERPLVFGLSLTPLPLFLVDNPLRDTPSRDRWVQFQSLSHRAYHFWSYLLWGSSADP